MIVCGIAATDAYMPIDRDDTGIFRMDVAKRLALTRRALRADQQSFGRDAGLAQPRYNQYETGDRLLTLAAAMLLCERYNLTLDWLYRGDPSGLPYRLAEEIKAARSKPND